MHNSLISVVDLQSLISSKAASTNTNKQSRPKSHILYTSMQSGVGVKPEIVLLKPNHFIPNSTHFDLKNVFSDKGSSLSNTMLDQATFSKEVQKLGINNQDDIVVYDDFGNFCASRVWFMFRAMGHQNIRVLDGGLPAWLRANLAVSYQCNDKPAEMGNFTAKADPNFEFVDKNFILHNLDTNHFTVIDARSADRFKGLTAESRVGLII